MRTLAAIVALAALLQSPAPKRVNELSLARLKPGMDILATAEKRFSAAIRVVRPESERTIEWRDRCAGRAVLLEMDEQGVIQSITVSSFVDPNVDCSAKAPALLSVKQLTTGRGLALGDSRKRVFTIYGEPDSKGPSTQGGQERELLYYQFDWAGPNVPQVMEVTCERASGRVVQITLAFPSL